MGATPPALRANQFKKKAGSSKPWDPDGDGDNDATKAGDTDGDRTALIKKYGPPPSTVKGVRDMVAAHKHVPAAKQAAHRAKCIAGARKCGAMHHIPSSWTSKKG
jgi:hypothetical protein